MRVGNMVMTEQPAKRDVRMYTRSFCWGVGNKSLPHMWKQSCTSKAPPLLCFNQSYCTVLVAGACWMLISCLLQKIWLLFCFHLQMFLIIGAWFDLWYHWRSQVLVRYASLWGHWGGLPGFEVVKPLYRFCWGTIKALDEITVIALFVSAGIFLFLRTRLHLNSHHTYIRFTTLPVIDERHDILCLWFQSNGTKTTSRFLSLCFTASLFGAICWRIERLVVKRDGGIEKSLGMLVSQFLRTTNTIHWDQSETWQKQSEEVL